MTAVLDASVVVKVLTEEPLSALATRVLSRESDRLAPDILTVEVASALSKKVRYYKLPREQADRAIAAIAHLGFVHLPSSDLIGRAMTLSTELRHALYDCLYLALAEAQNCALITSDEKFADVAAEGGFGSHIRRLSDLEP